MSRLVEVTEFMKEVDEAVNEFSRSMKSANYVVTGGAIRDTLLGQPVKDIDVVIENKFGFPPMPWPDEEYGPTGGFSATTAPIAVRGKPVQLIYRQGDISIRSMMEYHSLGVSNVFWKDGALIIDPVFLRDVNDRMHTVNRARWGGIGTLNEQRLDKYIKKITAKYPWPLRG